MEDETKTCFDCDFVYYSSKDDKWYCEDPREEYPIREVDPNSSACSWFHRFYKVEEEK